MAQCLGLVGGQDDRSWHLCDTLTREQPVEIDADTKQKLLAAADRLDGFVRVVDVSQRSTDLSTLDGEHESHFLEQWRRQDERAKHNGEVPLPLAVIAGDELLQNNEAEIILLLNEIGDVTRGYTDKLPTMFNRIRTIVDDFKAGKLDDVHAGMKMFQEMRCAKTMSELFRQDAEKATLAANVSNDRLMAPSEIAKAFGLKQNPLDQRLKRFRKANAEGWKEIDNPRRNKASYLYRIGAI